MAEQRGDRPEFRVNAGPVELAAWKREFEHGLTFSVKASKWFRASGKDQPQRTDQFDSRDLLFLAHAAQEMFKLCNDAERAARKKETAAESS